MTKIHLTRGFRITDATLTAMIKERARDSLPADAVLIGVDRDPATCVTFVGYSKLVDVEEWHRYVKAEANPLENDMSEFDYGDMRVTGQGAPIPSFFLGEDGTQS